MVTNSPNQTNQPFFPQSDWTTSSLTQISTLRSVLFPILFLSLLQRSVNAMDFVNQGIPVQDSSQASSLGLEWNHPAKLHRVELEKLFDTPQVLYSEIPVRNCILGEFFKYRVGEIDLSILKQVHCDALLVDFKPSIKNVAPQSTLIPAKILQFDDEIRIVFKSEFDSVEVKIPKDANLNFVVWESEEKKLGRTELRIDFRDSALGTLKQTLTFEPLPRPSEDYPKLVSIKLKGEKVAFSNETGIKERRKVEGIVFVVEEPLIISPHP